jgi:hypothetical protein
MTWIWFIRSEASVPWQRAGAASTGAARIRAAADRERRWMERGIGS